MEILELLKYKCIIHLNILLFISFRYSSHEPSYVYYLMNLSFFKWFPELLNYYCTENTNQVLLSLKYYNILTQMNETIYKITLSL